MIPRMTFQNEKDVSTVIAALQIAARESYSKSSQYSQAGNDSMGRYHLNRGEEYRELAYAAEEELVLVRQQNSELEMLAQEVRRTLDDVRMQGIHQCNNVNCLVNYPGEITADNVLELIREMQESVGPEVITVGTPFPLESLGFFQQRTQ